jgi:hypothetical protein
MPILSFAARLVFLLVVGALITPLAGYLGAMTIPHLITMWFVGLVFFFGVGLKAMLVLLIFPALVGAKWIWPVTCIVLPVADLMLRPWTARAIWIFALIGCVSAAATAYLLIELRVELINKINLGAFVVAGAWAGGVLGAIYGYILWRTERLWSHPQSAAVDRQTS